MTDAELGRLLGVVPVLADEAMIRLAVATGMRREDLVSVRLEGVDAGRGWVTFWEHKKRRPWRVPLQGRALQVIRQHMNTLPRGTPWLFPSPRDPERHLSSRQAYNRFQARLDAAGLKRRPFHALRATCIKAAQRRGWTTEEVMALTGDSWRVIQLAYATPTEGEMLQAARDRPLDPSENAGAET